MPTSTTNYGFSKPNVNSADDEDLWGDETNANWDLLDGLLKILGPQPGDLKDSAASTVPTGWLECDGSAVSRTTYAALFAAIGTTWGPGDGSTTFNIPDLGGRTTAGREGTATRLTSAVSGVNGAAIGATGGNQNMHQHTHTVTDPGHTHTTGFLGQVQGNGGGSGFNQAGPTNITSSSNTTGITIANAGTGSSQNVQPTAIVLKLIKT